MSYQHFHFDDMPPNVVYAVDTDVINNPTRKARFDANAVGKTVLPVLQEIIRTVALNNPNWKLIGSYMAYSEAPVEDFKVEESHEIIGELGYTKYFKGGSFYIQSREISQGMSRQSSRKTKDVRKALKLIGTMRKRTMEDMMTGVAVCLRDEMSSSSRQLRYKESNKLDEIVDKVRKYIRNNIQDSSHAEAIFSILQSSSVPMSDMNEYQEARDEYAMMEGISSGKGVSVAIRDGIYFVREEQPTIKPCWSTKDSESLPAYLRRGLGLLKLTEERTFVADVGFRGEKDTFFILERQHD